MCSLIQTRTHLLPAFPKTKSRENLCKQSPASSLNSKDTVRNFIHSLHQIQAIPLFHNFTEYRKSIRNLTTSATDCRTKLLSTETNSPVHRPPASTTNPIISRLPPKFHRTVNKDTDVTDDAILVTMDVNSLYPDQNATPHIYRNVQKAISSSHRSKPCNSAAPYLYQLQLFRIRLTYI